MRPPLAAVDTHAMRVVDHDPSVVAVSNDDRLVDEALIAVHAERAIAHDQFATATIGDAFQLSVQALEIQMTVPGERGAADPATVQERRVVQSILEGVISDAPERVDDSDVRAISAREKEGARATGEVREVGLQLLVGAGVSADQVRGVRRAGTPAIDCGLKGLDYPWIGCETEIVIATEVQEFAAGDLDRTALRTACLFRGS